MTPEYDGISGQATQIVSGLQDTIQRLRKGDMK